MTPQRTSVNKSGGYITKAVVGCFRCLWRARNFREVGKHQSSYAAERIWATFGKQCDGSPLCTFPANLVTNSAVMCTKMHSVFQGLGILVRCSTLGRSCTPLKSTIKGQMKENTYLPKVGTKIKKNKIKAEYVITAFASSLQQLALKHNLFFPIDLHWS